MMEMSDIPERVADYRVEELDGEILLYHVSSTRSFHLNEAAALVWNLCDGERSVAEIVELLQQSFPDDDGEQIGRDALDVIRRLVEERVLSMR